MGFKIWTEKFIATLDSILVYRYLKLKSMRQLEVVNHVRLFLTSALKKYWVLNFWDFKSDILVFNYFFNKKYH